MGLGILLGNVVPSTGLRLQQDGIVGVSFPIGQSRFSQPELIF